ncbi:aldo/keto reductase [Streptococcus sp. H31]|uniref:aldo/keto reductase n=1 Tax=Streptococcus huangxiaojuni TaxID=3237239 RepID=UPI0034A4041A
MMRKKLLAVLVLLLALVGAGFWRGLSNQSKQSSTKPIQKEGSAAIMPQFDAKKQTVTLNDGNIMPVYGLGTYSLTGSTVKEAVSSALKQGYRLIDTAYMYHNEKEIGEAIRESGIPREEIFLTTKIYPSQFDDPESAIEAALDELDIDYIDMMLLHHPGDNDVKAYQAMEKYQKAGKIKSIGLSNYYIDELKAFLPQVETMPALVQNEIHPYYQDSEATTYIQSLGIVVEAWYPLGGRGYQEELLSDPVLEKIAEKYDKSVAQIILRWEQQRQIITIPGSSNPEHQAENQAIFDFQLTEEEMQEINQLNRDEKHDWY